MNLLTSITKTIRLLAFVLLSMCYLCNNSLAQKNISITIDDPNTYTKELPWQEINKRILNTLSKHKLQAALFVCVMRVSDAAGVLLVNEWDKQGHLICNHSYSHTYFNSKKISAFSYIKDFEHGDSVIKQYENYTKLYRFPYLKEGDTKVKIDSMRVALKSKGYNNGHVSIDASDWFIDAKIHEQLKLNMAANLRPYKDYYIKHLLNRAYYYDSLANNNLHQQVKHTLLLHHSLLNALFLEDIIQAFKNDGWKFINASDAYADLIYTQQPSIVPCGESIVWQLVEAQGTYSEKLRYPAEDGDYEDAPLKQFIKNYTVKQKPLSLFTLIKK
jgi:peptidoglycan-N-acetylglucosamine deacetylase